jgi:hypothetical protein
MTPLAPFTDDDQRQSLKGLQQACNRRSAVARVGLPTSLPAAASWAWPGVGGRNIPAAAAPQPDRQHTDQFGRVVSPLRIQRSQRPEAPAVDPGPA